MMTGAVFDEAVLAQNEVDTRRCVVRCRIGHALNELKDDDAAQLRAVIANDAFWNATIVRLFANRHIVVFATSVRRHRVGICDCP